MNNRILRSVTAVCFVCVFSVLMCAFFIDDVHAAQVAAGKTTKNEQTFKVKLTEGTALVTVRDYDSWVYAQLQETGSDELGTALNGENVLAEIDQRKSFTVPIRKTGTYYLYLHGVNEGTYYTIQQYTTGGTLKSGSPKTGTSFGDNQTVSFYRIKVPAAGKLRVTVKDASPRYAGYSKIQLKKGDNVVSGEEHLIKGLGFSTVYGVSQGTYYIGVRSSSELYKITATFKSVKQHKYGTKKGNAVLIAKGNEAAGVIEPGDTSARWYRIDLPKGKGGKKTITISSDNNNFDLAGGTACTFSYKTKSGKKYQSVSDKYILNTDKQSYQFSTWANKVRTVYVKIAASGNCCGTYTVSWK